MVVPGTRPNHCDLLSPEPLLVAGPLTAAAPPEIFDPFPMEVHSTKQEAQVVDAELRRRGIKKAIVVTSNFHTRRARHIFHQQGGDETEYLLASAPNPHFEPDDWWRCREGKKVFLLKALKILNAWVE